MKRKRKYDRTEVKQDTAFTIRDQLNYQSQDGTKNQYRRALEAEKLLHQATELKLVLRTYWLLLSGTMNILLGAALLYIILAK